MKYSFDPDDARLTAYALGELHGADLGEIEALLAQSEEARRFVDELRGTSELLARELAKEPAMALNEEQHARIEQQLSQGDSTAMPAMKTARARRALPTGARYAIAASVLAAFASGVIYVVRYQPDTGPFFYGIGGSDVAWVSHRNPAAPPPAKKLGLPKSGLAPVAHEEFRAFDTGEALDRVAGKDGVVAVAADKSLNELLEQSPVLRDGEHPFNTESYSTIVENDFHRAVDEALSTFSIDVDTASYANVRRYLSSGQLPPADAVRIEELVNYFRYAYPAPQGAQPFSVTTEVASCPWAPTHRLVHIGLRGKDIPVAERAPSNLVFLIDVSGSMDDDRKLPLLKQSMKLLVEQLDARDRVAMVVYAGASGLALPPTSCSSKAVILAAVDSLAASGSTNGAAGIELAYQLAAESFVKGGINRVILCTDGDFNVGVTDEGSLVRLIEQKRESGVFLSVLGFGTGNTKDSNMEKLADKGNGNYAYIDSLAEARKVLVTEMGGTLIPIAQDVKIQVEFNPLNVQAWRLIGYENRALAHQDFNDDKKDAGEIGAGVTVTALYEVVPVGVAFEGASVDPLRYRQTVRASTEAFSGELLNLKLRYKEPAGDTSQLIQTPVADSRNGWQEASSDFKFSAAVAEFGMLLRQSKHAGSMQFADVSRLATEGLGEDSEGYRREFLELVNKAQNRR